MGMIKTLEIVALFGISVFFVIFSCFLATFNDCYKSDIWSTFNNE